MKLKITFVGMTRESVYDSRLCVLTIMLLTCHPDTSLRSVQGAEGSEAAATTAFE